MSRNAIDQSFTANNKVPIVPYAKNRVRPSKSAVIWPRHEFVVRGARQKPECKRGRYSPFDEIPVTDANVSNARFFLSYNPMIESSNNGT
jgi:hypothetical protein